MLEVHPNDSDDDIYEVGKGEADIADKDNLLMSDKAYPELIQRARERQRQLQMEQGDRRAGGRCS